MKRYLLLVLSALIFISCLAGCGEETVPKDTELETLEPQKGTTLEKRTDIEGFEFITTYDTGNYDLSRWRITDSKTLNITAGVKNLPEGTTVFIEHVHIDIGLKSTDAQLDGQPQDSMDAAWHGTSQEGYWISEKYPYQLQFSIAGYSKDLISGWQFVSGSYGSGSIRQERLTEKNLVEIGKVYGNKMQVVYSIAIKHSGEEFFHTVSVTDEFQIPVAYKPVENE